MQKVKHRLFLVVLISVVALGYSSNDLSPRYHVDDHLRVSFFDPTIELLGPARVRRDAPEVPTVPGGPAAAAAPEVPAAPTAPAAPEPAPNATDANKTLKDASGGAAEGIKLRIPLLGVNGSGILRTNRTGQPMVSDPILDDDDNLTEAFRRTPEAIQAQHNMTQLKYDNHTFYSSTFIGNETYFQEFWNEITSGKTTVHAMLSNSYRHAAPVNLSFQFPFYGHPLSSVTVATGGFVYMGEHVHDWLAATQYVAPLMANFMTNVTVESVVRIKDDGEKFTVIWEKVPLQEEQTKLFTFAVTFFKSGDIVFAYKDVPIAVQQMDDTHHPVKIGISDAYQTDRIVLYLRRKTIYEYHRVSFTNHMITNHTILRLTALPTCLKYTSCDACLHHETSFNCTWCANIQKCSGGTDRNKQDWMLRKCEKTQIANASQCEAPRAEPEPTPAAAAAAAAASSSTEQTVRKSKLGPWAEPAPPPRLGGAAAACAVVALLAALAGWAVYAFKNPHTRSGQLLIKYRPSQWSWKRGEARYTAATIHM